MTTQQHPDQLRDRATSNQHNFFTKTEVMERGWTEGAIKKFLGNPDKTAPNRYSKKKSEVKLFCQNRVKGIEKTGEWQDWYQTIKKQRNKRDLLRKQRTEREDSIIKQNPIMSYDGRIRLEDIREEIALDYDWLSEEMRLKTQKTILESLKKSWWFPVDRLLVQFYRTTETETVQTFEKISSLAQSIFEKGWKGLPLIAWYGYPTCDSNDKEFLLSGYHRLEALKQLREGEKIGKDLLVPVFSLEANWDWLSSQMPKKDKKILRMVDGELHYLTLKELCRHGSGFLPLATGLDNF